MKIKNALVSNILDRSQRYFAHVTTVTLSWRVQNIVVIGRVYFTLECFEFSSNFEFDRNMLSGTGAWSNNSINSSNTPAWPHQIRGVLGINLFKLRNFAVLAIECFFLQQLIEAVYWTEYIDGPWWSMVACTLNLWRLSTTVISIGMEHLSLVKLLLIYLNRLTTIIKYFGGCKI